MLSALLGNSQRLDGGAMFGNAPRALWSRWAPPDAENRIALACRALLLREAGRNLLFETGIGAFFDPRQRERFGVVEPTHRLLESLEAVGLSHADIDVVVLSHLHFDHAGGLLAAWEEGAAHRLLFPRATFVVSDTAWERAVHPHVRDRASFIPGLCELLEASGRLVKVAGNEWDGLRFHRSEGHTPGLLLAEIPDATGRPVVFGADLIPGAPWVHAPITMGYDRFPERLIEEKTALLTELVSRGGALFFTHDPEVALGRVVLENGRFTLSERVGQPDTHPVVALG